MAMTNSEKIMIAKIMIRDEIRKAGVRVAHYKPEHVAKAAKAFLKCPEGAVFVEEIQAVLDKRYGA